MGQQNEALFTENEAFKEKFGFLLSEHRKKNNLTQDQLAELINLSDNTISETERGNRNCIVYNFYLCIHSLSIPQGEVIKLLYNPSYLPEGIRNELCGRKDRQ